MQDDKLARRLGANSWMKDLDEQAKAHEAIEKEPFAPTATPEERGAGVAESTLPNPMRYAFEPSSIRAVVRIIDDRLMAVKLISPTGETSYAIYDRESMRPVRQSVASLDELLRQLSVQN